MAKNHYLVLAPESMVGTSTTTPSLAYLGRQMMSVAFLYEMSDSSFGKCWFVGEIVLRSESSRFYNPIRSTVHMY